MRKWLRASVRGDVYAFNQLTLPYIDLVLEYLAASGYVDAFRRREVAQQVFEAIWVRLGYAKRVSDFEYLLGRILLQHNGLETSGNPVVDALAALPPEPRFAVVAREMEDWHPYWIALCLRENRQQTRLNLLQARAALVGIDLDGIAPEGRALMESVSDCLDKDATNQDRTRLALELAKDADVRSFKADWLSLRCDLIDCRQDWRFTEEERAAFQKGLGDQLRFVPVGHPSWSNRLRNALYFSQFPEYHPS